MDSAAAKAYEMQARVRHNADQYQSVIKDLYNWEQEMKDKEKALLQKPAYSGTTDNLKTLPVRSHVQEQPKNKGKKIEDISKPAKDSKDKLNAKSPITEKQDTPLDPVLIKHKEANELKDRGNQFVKVNDFKNAIIEYTKAIELFGEDAVYYSNRALCYLRMEMYEDCIEDCNKAIAVDSQCKKAFYRRMQANESLGNHMDALKDCTTVLTLEPNNKEATKSLERINNRLNQNVIVPKGPNFSADRDDLFEIRPVNKPASKRSTKPLKRINVAEIITNRNVKPQEPLKISDEDIDKLFNSNCGPFVEVKKGTKDSENTQKEPLNAQIKLEVKEETVIKLEENQPDRKIEENVEKRMTETVKSETTKPEEPPVKASATQDIVQIKNENQEQQSVSSNKENIKRRPLPPPPTSTAQFHINWRELPWELKYEYLKSIELGNLTNILGAGFSSENLTDVLKVLHDYYVPNKESSTAATLLEISKNSQVNILSLLMSDEDHRRFTRILNTFAAYQIPEPVVQQIKRNFNFN